MFRCIVPVISGKGGVGKSTVATNLALSLAKQGSKVALIDCDFYGPSVPTLLGGGKLAQDGEGKFIPAQKFGVKYISIGFFLQHPDDPVIWRGPMTTKMLRDLFEGVNWGECDYAILDMPPGTGDTIISLTQMTKVHGAVVVTTPQEVALADVRKSINMLNRVNVSVLGIVENMAGFALPDGKIVSIFGAGGGQRTADEYGVPLLASIPLDPAIGESGDKGEPIANSEKSPVAGLFRELALKVASILDKKLAEEPTVSIVN